MRLAITNARRVLVGLVRPGDVLVDALGEEVGTVVSMATPSPLKYDREASITFEGDAGRQTIELTAGSYVWVRGVA